MNVQKMSLLEEKYGDLTVLQLKTLLRERGGSLKGKKKDLIDRLKFYDENNNFKSKSSTESHADYHMPAEFVTPEFSLYKDINADSCLPALTMLNIENYVDRFSIGMKSGKKLYENFFLLSVRMASKEDKYFFQSRCKASMKKAVTYISNIQISPTGIIEACQCECAVGEPPNAHCKHIIASLLAVEHLRREHKILLHATCTQELQQFHKPKKQYFGSPVKAQNLPDSYSNPINFKPIRQKVDAAKYRERVRNLCIGYLSRSNSTMPFKQTIRPANLYAVVHDHDYVGNTEKEVLKSLKIVDIVDDDIKEIERLTREQHKCQRWQYERQNRITASKFYSCCNTISHEAKENLVQRILNPRSFKSKQTQHGKDCESKAIQIYESFGVDITKCGLIIMKNNPFLGASPDALIGDNTVLEVKCPYNQRNLEINPQTIPFLYEDNYGRWCLDPTHEYWYQIQGQLMVTGRKYANLLIYTFVDWKVIDVPRSDVFINEMETKLSAFYNKYFKPALLEKHLYKNYSKCFFRHSNV